MSVTDAAATTLDTATLARFVRDGYLTVQTSLPPSFHVDVCRRAGAILDREGNWGNNMLPRLPELRHVLADAAVHGALTSLLGPTYVLHPHRYCHRNEPGSTAQRLHKDTREFSGDRHLRHPRPRWLIAFYYPHDVTAEMGPTAIVPGSQYYLEPPEGGASPEMLVRVPGGSVTIVHFGIWHRATSNRSNQPRYMFKFQFARMDEPLPGVEPDPVAWDTGASQAPHTGLWSSVLGWLQGNGQVACEQVAESAIDALAAEDVYTRRAAADAFAVAGSDTDTIPRLAQALSDVDEPVRLNAAQALAAAGKAALPVLDAALRAPDGPARRHATHALSEMGVAAVELLVERARDADEQVAINAIDALSNMGAAAEPAEPALRAALKADNPWLRRHATEALGILGSSARLAVGDLADALCDEQPYVRFNTATALARIGPSAGEATPALVKALGDPDRYTRGWAVQALQRIGTPEALNALVDHLMLARWCSTTQTDDRY
jgi:HEAT repeat protein